MRATNFNRRNPRPAPPFSTAVNSCRNLVRGWSKSGPPYDLQGVICNSLIFNWLILNEMIVNYDDRIRGVAVTDFMHPPDQGGIAPALATTPPSFAPVAFPWKPALTRPRPKRRRRGPDWPMVPSRH